MSSAPASTSPPPRPARSTRARLFGVCIRRLRLARGLTAAEAAALAGVEFSEWIAVEDGYVPADPARLHPMAAVLEVDWEGIRTLALFCRGGG